MWNLNIALLGSKKCCDQEKYDKKSTGHITWTLGKTD